MTTTEPDLSQDVIFEILSNPRRRYVLYYLRSTEETVVLTDLAEEVAAWENGVETDEITDQQRKRVYVSLYQTHVPRLAEAGLIEYDRESGAITLTEQAAGIDRYLNTTEDSLPWQRIYVALAAGSAAVLGLTVVVESVPEQVAAVAVGLAVVLTVLLQYIWRQSRTTVPDELSNRE